MKATKQITFSAMNSMSDKRLLNIQARYIPSSEQYKMIDYELKIRKIELPEYLKLNN